MAVIRDADQPRYRVDQLARREPRQRVRATYNVFYGWCIVGLALMIAICVWIATPLQLH